MGRDPCVAQLTQLVEEPEGVDPVAEEIGPGAKLDPIAARCPIGRHRRLGCGCLRFGRGIGGIRRQAAGVARFGHGSRRRCGPPLLEAHESLFQIGRSLRRPAFDGLVQGDAEVVLRPQEDRDRPARDGHATGADVVQDGLDLVRELGDRPQADHPGGPLERVGGPEGPVQVLAVPLARLQVHQPRFQGLEQLVRLIEEQAEEAIGQGRDLLEPRVLR